MNPPHNQPSRPPRSLASGRPSRHLRSTFESPKNPIDELLLRPFIASCVGQLGDVTDGKILMLRSLIPVVTDCLVSVVRGFDSRTQHQDEKGDNNALNIKLAQALFRKNPNYAPQSNMQKVITQVINEEIVALQVRNKQALYAKHSTVISELFHNYDHDGDAYITLNEIKNLLHDVGSILGFNVLQAHALIEMLDFHNTGKVDFLDFETGMKQLFKEDQIKSALKLVTEEEKNPQDVHLRMMSHREEFLLKHAENAMYKMLKKKNFNLRNLFNELDRNQDDSLSLKELTNALRGLSGELENHSSTSNASNTTTKNSSNRDFSDETIALLLSKEKIDKDGDHRVDYLEFQKFAIQLMKQHGVVVARKASFEATLAARLKLWDSACRTIKRTESKYRTLESMFADVHDKSKQIDPREKTLTDVLHNGKASRDALDKTLLRISDTKMIISKGFQDQSYRKLIELSLACNDACQTAKPLVRTYSKSVWLGLQLHEELVEANHVVNDHFDCFSILKGRSQELQSRYDLQKKTRTYTNEHTTHAMFSLNNALNTCNDLRRKSAIHLTSQVELDHMNTFLVQVNQLEKKLIVAANEVEDVDILEQADIASDAALRSASLDAMGRSLVAAVCKSASPQNVCVALFLQTSPTEATCVACGQQGINSIFSNADTSKISKTMEDQDEKIVVGTTSVAGDHFGFDSLRSGAVHKKGTFVQPLNVKKDHHHTSAFLPFAYLYIKKDKNEEKPLSPRLNRFIKTISIMSAKRMSNLEQIDRLLRLAKCASSMLNNVSSASTFVGLRLGQSGIKFLSGTKKYLSLLNIFMKATHARTLMAASESNVEPRSARCKGPCLAWRCGQPIENISIIVGVADMTTDVYHAEIFKATQSAAAELNGNDRGGPSYHLGDAAVKNVFQKKRMIELVGGGGSFPTCT